VVKLHSSAERADDRLTMIRMKELSPK
jgi:hypothetical protein